MSSKIYVLLFLAVSLNAQDSSKYSDYPISAVSIKNVVLNDNFWLPKIKTIQESTIPYAFDKCEKEGRMENFLIAGGKKKGAYKSKFPFDDTDLYKIIEGASLSLISKPNPELDAYIDSIIAIIQIGQESDGYITTWFTINPQNPPRSWVKPSNTRWENEVSSHELYNSGHLFEAAAAHYWATGKRNFLGIALKNADLLVENFGLNKLRIPRCDNESFTSLGNVMQMQFNLSVFTGNKFCLSNYSTKETGGYVDIDWFRTNMVPIF